MKKINQTKRRCKKRRAKKGRILLLLLLILLVAGAVVILLYQLKIISYFSYDNADFGIEDYVSSVDKDSDGINDQQDILESAKDYVATKPKYKSQYYIGGYPNDGYGVCTDVIAQALLNSGYDLMQLVNADILAHPADYKLEKPDINIDFRRVVNLDIYFQHTAISLTTDINKIEEWQGGDIVVFPKHIGIVSDKRNAEGIPLLIHHSNPVQVHYEQDKLGVRDDIIGHYRIS